MNFLLEFNTAQNAFHFNWYKNGQFDHPMYKDGWTPIFMCPEELAT